MQAISVKYFLYTSHRPARFKVSASAGIEWFKAGGLVKEDRYREVAEAYANRLGWLDGYHLEGGTLADQETMVFVLVKDLK